MTTAEEIDDPAEPAGGWHRVGLSSLRAWVRWQGRSLNMLITILIPLVVAVSTSAALLWRDRAMAESARADHQFVQVETDVSTLLTAIQAERATTAASMLSPNTSSQLATARTKVDSAVRQFDSAVSAVDIPGAAAGTARAQLSRLSTLRALSDPTQVIDEYSTVTTSLLDLNSALAAQVVDGQLLAQLDATDDLARAVDGMAVQQSLLDVGLSQGSLSDAGLALAGESATLASSSLDTFTTAAPAGLLDFYRSSVSSGQLDARAKQAIAILGPGGNIVAAGNPVSQWNSVSQPVIDEIAQLSSQVNEVTLTTATTNAEVATRQLWIMLGALIVSLLIAGMMAVAVYRNLWKSLGTLQNAAIDIADKQLPEALVQVRDGRVSSIDGPHLPIASEDTIGTVARAFEEVCGQALEAAAELATLRAGYSDVFANVFRRSQSLVQRQLHLIEQLEGTDQSPDQLAMLYQLDHLATRTRRNNENVMILSGFGLNHVSTRPLRVSDILRAATSEIALYQRVEIIEPPEVKIIDSAATDLIRLVAELLDNATSFSPPDTTVTVSSNLLRDQTLVIEIVDRGIGLSDNELSETNERLAQIGSIDLARSRRVGLIVVGRLAGRHGFDVELLGGQNSDGITAMITVPADLIVGARPSVWLHRRSEEEVEPRPVARRTEPAALAPARTPGVSSLPVHAMAGADTDRKPRVASFRDSGSVDAMVEARRRDRIAAAHADIPKELPMRKPNRLIGARRVTGKSREEEAASGWFRSRASGNPADVPSVAGVTESQYSGRQKITQPRNWSSAADAGWTAVQSVASARRQSQTETGLPQRERGAYLLPGSAIASRAREGANAIKRNPEVTRGRLSSFQQGLRKARRFDRDEARKSKRSDGWTVLDIPK